MRSKVLALIGVLLFFGILIWAFFYAPLGAPSQSQLLQRIFGLSSDTAFVFVFIIRKLVHIFGFAFFSVCVMSIMDRSNRHRVRIALGMACVVAIVDETLQATVAWRSGQALDLVLDIVGAATGVVLLNYAAAQYRLQKGRQGKEK